MSNDVPQGYQSWPFDRGFEPLVGPLYVRLEGPNVRVAFRVASHHLNIRGHLHGGMLMTLIDEAVALAAAHSLGSDAAFATISLNCDFVAPGEKDDWVEAEAELVRRTRRLLFARAQAVVGQKLLVTASGINRVFHSAVS